MKPVKAVRKQLGELLAADPTTLAPAADANKVKLVKEPFVFSETMTVDDLELADFDGSTPLAAGIGTQACGIDPATGEQNITVKEPAGGWRWETTGVTNLPQTIYGYALTNLAGTVLLGVHVLDTPITLQEAGQELNLGTVKMSIIANPMN